MEQTRGMDAGPPLEDQQNNLEYGCHDKQDNVHGRSGQDGREHARPVAGLRRSGHQGAAAERPQVHLPRNAEPAPRKKLRPISDADRKHPDAGQLARRSMRQLVRRDDGIGDPYQKQHVGGDTPRPMAEGIRIQYHKDEGDEEDREQLLADKNLFPAGGAIGALHQPGPLLSHQKSLLDIRFQAAVAAFHRGSACGEYPALSFRLPGRRSHFHKPAPSRIKIAIPLNNAPARKQAAYK